MTLEEKRLLEDKIQRLQHQVSMLEQEKVEPIAVIGMACRFPGGANDPASFWEVLSEGRCTVKETPKDRWDTAKFFSHTVDEPGKMYTNQGAYIDGVDMFDPEFFSITPKEAEYMDPQQRIFMETAWEAIESAGILSKDLLESKTGVYLGVSSHDFVTHCLSNGMQGVNAYYGTGTQFSLAVGRLSYWLGLQGPSMVIDTACSSSLVAVHEACQSLRNKDSNIAIAGGIHLILSPELTIYCSKAKMISKDGKCKTFDEKADGYGRGEGCGVIILKRLSDAKKNKDNILAVIRGSSVNQDGKSAGITAPNRASQEKLITNCLEMFNTHPGDVSYMECHGTGTILGDPIELNALNTVYGNSHNEENPLHIGSVKTNISHLEAAAGIAGLIKVILSLQNKTIAPHVNFDKINPHINICQNSFKINTNPVPWPSSAPRIAGVSSFGFSGTNAFALVEEAPTNIIPTCDAAPYQHEAYILPLTAKNAPALQALVEKYIAYLEVTQDTFGDICYTASTAKSPFSHRLVIMSENKKDCISKLKKHKKEEVQEGVWQAVAKASAKSKYAFYFPDKVRMSNRDLTKYIDIMSSQATEGIAYRDLIKSFLKNNSLPSSNTETNVLAFIAMYLSGERWMNYGIDPDLWIADGVGILVISCLKGLLSLEAATRTVLDSQDLAPLVSQLHQDSSVIIHVEGRDLAASLQSRGLYNFVGFGEKINSSSIEGDRFSWIQEMDITACSWPDFMKKIVGGFLQGKDIAWDNIYTESKVSKVVLPSYPFQRKKLWPEFAPLN